MQKLGPHIVFFPFSVGCCFYEFLGCFLVILCFSMDVHIDLRIDYYFSTLFLSVG